MQTLQKCKIKDIKTLNLKGVEVTEVVETSSDDLRAITLKDTITGTVLAIRMNQYSEFCLNIEKPKKFEKAFSVVGKIGPALAEAVFETKEKAEEWVEDQSVGEPVITEIQKEVVE